MYPADDIFARISDAVVHARSFEELVRPLLELLELITGLETAYLTRIDAQIGQQHILFSHNTEMLNIPEGSSVPWNDTLCKRALDDGQFYTQDVSQCWGDSKAAQLLGIVTYVSKPIHHKNGTIYGTLCAASSKPQPITDRGQQILNLFAALITHQFQREQLMEELRATNDKLEQISNTDILTSLPNRRFTLEEMERLFSIAERAGKSIHIAYIDLDNFKSINDTYGHDVGDSFLREITLRLSKDMRTGDLLGRLGGDEFVIVGIGPSIADSDSVHVTALNNRLLSLTQGFFEFKDCAFEYPGASCGVVCINPAITSPEEALRLADKKMYEQKKSRKRL